MNKEQLVPKISVVNVISLIAALIVGAVIYALLIPVDVAIAGAIAITAGAAILWITEALPLPVTSLLIPVGLTSVGVFQSNTAFNSFGNPVIFLILGGYAIAVAFQENGIDRWIANHILGVAGTRTLAVLTGFMFTAAALSTILSNSAATALLLPVALGVIAHNGKDKNLSRVLVLGVAYGASIGGVATLIGSPPNAIAAGLLDISFLEWLSFGVPISVAMLLIAIPILWRIYTPENQRITVQLDADPPLTKLGKRTLAVSGITILLWLFGATLSNSLGVPHLLSSSASVAVIAIALFTLTKCVAWKAIEKGVQWSVLLLLGGGLTLGRGLTESGAANWLAAMLVANTSELSLFILLLAIVSIAVFSTELISNTAITSKLAPILISMALQLGLDSQNLVASMAIASSMAFMLPVATPPNAMVYATGHVLQKDMIRVGLFLNIAAIVIITVSFYFRMTF